MYRVSLGSAVALCAAANAFAEPPSVGAAPKPEAAFEATLRWKTGEVSLGDGVARLAVTPQWRYLGPEDAERVLVDAWHNPPGHEGTLGMLFPSDVGPLDADGWGVVISYAAEGHVSDADAEEQDYEALLHDMQAAVREQNEKRVRDGYPPVELLGWAARPYYDRAAHKLHWARELRFGTDEEHTLNYDVRVLGRRGMLVMQAVAPMTRAELVQARMRDALALVEFEPGHRYDEFDSGVDRVAAYGIGGLVAGGILAKAGFFKVLLVALLAAKKFVAIGVLAAVGLISRYFRRNRPASTG
ncbi:MAG TPA: DUF2167 domain-containing protein [Myxococcota bacterium]|nr:DUF2167 domain-containing protein [Myxococcota bacterium]